MRYQILKTGEKVLKIRTELGVSQETLAGKRLTRGTISQIEGGTMVITPKTAEKIVKAAQTIASNKEGTIDISVEYLLEKQEQQVERIAKKYIVDLAHLTIVKGGDNEFEKLAHEFQYFSYDYNISSEMKLEFYKIYKDFYKERCDYTHQNLYVIKAIDAARMCRKYNDALSLMEEQSNLFYALATSVHEKREEYFNEMMDICNDALEFYENYKIDNKPTLISLMYNKSLVHKELLQNDLCLKITNEIYKIDYKIKDEMMLNVKNLQASVYLDEKKYDICEKLYQEILTEALLKKNSENVVKAYRSLSEVYLGKSNIKKAQEYLFNALDLKGLDNTQKLLIYDFTLTLDISAKSKLYEIENTFMNCTKIALEINDIHKYFELHNRIIDYYIEIDYEQGILKVLNNLKVNVKDKICNNKKIIICLYKIAIFLKIKNNHMSDEILNLIKKFNIESKNP
jgi:transcriptional regulator with XRE-family HTH domain